MSEDSGQAADYYYFLLARILQHSGLTDIILQATPNAYYPYSGTEQRKTDAPGASEPCPGPGHGGTAPVLADEHGALLPAQFPGPRTVPRSPPPRRPRRSPPSCGEEEAVRIRTQFSPQLESWKEKTAAQRWRPGAGPVRSSSSEELQSKSEHLHLHRLQQIRAQHCGFVAKNSSLS